MNPVPARALSARPNLSPVAPPATSAASASPEDRMLGARSEAPDLHLRTTLRVAHGGHTNLVRLDAHFRPDLAARNELGMATWSPVSAPWAAAGDRTAAISAVRNAQILPGLKDDVLAAALAFRNAIAKDPSAAAEAFIFAMASEQKSQTNRLREDVRGALQPVIRQFSEPDAERVRQTAALLGASIEVPSRSGGAERIREVSPELRARFMAALEGGLRDGQPFAVATEQALSTLSIPLKLETDAIKLLSSHFSGERIDLKDTAYEQADATKVGPAQYNTALHPMATGLMRLAAERVIDGLAPGDEVVVMAGGVAAGKGFAAKQASLGFDTAKVLFDFDGESSQAMLSTLLDMCRSRGVQMNVVGVVTDPVAAHIRSLTRTREEGRTVSETAAAYSHTVGVDNLIRFAEAHRGSPDVEVVFVENKGKPMLFDGLPPPPPAFGETLEAFQAITDGMVQQGRVPDWVRARYDGREGASLFMMGKIDELEQHGLPSFVVDSLMEDRHVHAQANVR